MSHSGRPRRLAAILFLDIVGSTQIATEVGDRRWRDLLGRFRTIVRAEVKRYKGREEDTAGDGFFATFAQPAMCVRAAVAITRRVQALGLDVRCGVHFGETEAIEGHRGGVAAHIGSRVMSLGGAAEVLVTGTVRDLMVGADVEIEDAGIHTLKGVPGSWQVWRLRTLDGIRMPEPLDPSIAHATRDQQPGASRQQRDRVILAGGVAGLLFLGVAALFLSRQPPPPTRPAAQPSAGPRLTVLKVDPLTNHVTLQVRDAYRSNKSYQLVASAGVLWQIMSTDALVGLVRRDMRNGTVVDKIAFTQEPFTSFGFGSAWVANLAGEGGIDRWDVVTHRKVTTIHLPHWVWSLDPGPTAMWIITADHVLTELDPITNAPRNTYPIPLTGADLVVPTKDAVWISAHESGELVEFNPRHHAFGRTLRTGHGGNLIGLTSGPSGDILWMLDEDGGTMTPIDATSGKPGQPIGIGVNAHAATIGFNSVWVAAGNEVLRLRGTLPDMVARIKMPAGFSAGSIAADAESGSIWVGDCGCRIK
jgi:class 3 adenylate cyclase